MTWQENYKKAVSILLGVPADKLELDEEYAKNIILGGYIDFADEKAEDEYLFEMTCRPCWPKERQAESRMCTDLGTPSGDYQFPGEAYELLMEAVKEVEEIWGTL